MDEYEERSDEEPLQRYIELCKRIYKRLRDDGTLQETLDRAQARRLAEEGRAELAALMEQYFPAPQCVAALYFQPKKKP